jgi:hypothetical protein
MNEWNPWKVTALAMALVMATALVAGLVVANWPGPSQQAAQPISPASARLNQPPKPASVKPSATPAAAAPAAPSAPAVPTQEIVDACNRYASAQVGETDKAKEVVKGAAGTLYGLNENKTNDEKYRTAYASCMHAKGYTG